jgi:DNA-binding response OmpR family regulator
MRILLVEDNIRLSEAIAECIAKSGFEISVVHTGGDALAAVNKGPYDLLILDLGLPDMDGFAVLHSIRASKNVLPVLILTARDSLSDRIKGVNRGADDYMLKPFIPEELIQRIRSLMRISEPQAGIVVLNNLSFDTSRRLTKVRDVAVSLSEPETEVLEQLLLFRGKLVPKKALQSRLDCKSKAGPPKSVESLVNVLRNKLHTHEAKIEIHTLHGIGYMLASSQEGRFQ